jgi:hypothetical protein
MAATNVSLLQINRTSAAALAQYQPVQASGVAAVAAGNALGFAQTAVAAAGALYPVIVEGTSIAIAGAAIAVGAAVEVHTTVTQVVTKAAGIAIGRALTAAANAGDQIEVLIIQQ